jgi:prophage DNA circulation protein
MPQPWDDILQEGSYGGVKFDFVSVRDEFSNDTDQQKFPGAAGTRIVPRGRNSARHEITAIILDEDYPEKMYDLVAQLDDGGKVKSFVHPIFGETKAACERFTVNHDAEDARDSCTISITLVEDLIEDLDLVSRTNTVPALGNAVRSLATEALEALSTFQAALEIQNSEIGLAVTGAMNAATSLSESLEASFEDLSTLAIQASTNGVLAQVDEAAALLADYESTEMYDLSAAVLATGNAVRDMTTAIIEARPVLSTFTVLADTNLLQLAHDFGQDPDELLTLNSFADPSLIAAGTQWLGYVDDE